jgi:hypothetical protein
MQLPSRATLQSYTGAFLHQPGAIQDCISEQVAQYILHCHERVKQGKAASHKVGVLIFDEVKLINRLLWNSRSQNIVGLSMNHSDLSSLADVYQMLSDNQVKQTSYIMQFLWRDLTGDYDIVGPYFTCSQTISSRFVYCCLMETIKLFHLHGLKIMLLICDGASSNLTTIKATQGQFGAFPINKDQEDPYKLKNMINALHSSGPGGTKSFIYDGVLFGWDAILSMYKRESKRLKRNETRMVHRLKEVHVIRDSWTKLNVTPAKIMQQEHVLSELYNYIITNHDAEDVASVTNTLKYLESCHKIFERGFLSHCKVTSMDCEVLKSIDDAYKFFTDWINQLNSEANFDHDNSSQRKFLAWQS